MMIDPKKLTIPASLAVSLLAFSFGALTWADIRYASADSVQKLSGKIDEARIQQLEDRVFELQLIERRTAAQQAMLERYKAQLEALRSGYRK